MFKEVIDSDWSWKARTNSDLGISSNTELSDSTFCENYFDFTEPSFNSNNNNDTEISELRITYSNDLDLKAIHNLVREKIIYIYQKIKKSDVQIDAIEYKILNFNLPPIDVKDLERKSNEILLFKRKYFGINLWEQYKISVLPILIKYISLSSMKNSSIDDNMIEERLEYIKQYIDIINKIGIFKIRSTKINTNKSICPGCLKEIERPFENEEPDYICNCGFIENNVKHISEYVDCTKNFQQSTIINNSIKIIQTWLNRLLCRSGEIYPQNEMFNKFDLYCVENNLPLRVDVINGRLNQPPMQTIIFLIQNNGYSEFFPLKSQIRHDYYDSDIIEITDIQESSLFKLYIDFQTGYGVIKKRKTNINIEILGCILLMILGVQVNVEDFKIPSSMDTIAYSIQSISDVLLYIGIEEENIPNIFSLFM